MVPNIGLAGRSISQGGRCFIIAEAGSNHDGRLAQARDLIDVAADAGADAVKFQLFTASGLYPPNCGVVETPAGEEDFYALLERLELPAAWLPELAAHSRSRGILLLLSVFDPATADLATAYIPAFKIASPELTYLSLLRYIAGRGLPIVLSTGMSRLGEIEESLEVLRLAGARDVALLHCVTAYPTPLRDCNLDVIPMLADVFDVPVGWSDHTIDPVVAPQVATALGACIIEKHFTISRRLSGPDHPFAVEPDELAAMVREVHALDSLPPEDRLAAVTSLLGIERVEELRGRATKSIAASEAVLALVDRRSLHALQDIEPGEMLSERNVGVLRGERNLRPGLHPRYWPVFDGARATRRIDQGAGLIWDDIVARDREGPSDA